MEITVNLWAVLVAALVYMAVGFMWYGPLFGNLWKRLMGLTDESMRNMKLSGAQAMGMGFVTSLIMAYVLGYFVMLTGAMGIAGAWKLAFWIWLGFMATVSAGVFIWEGKSFKLFVLNAAEQLVVLFLMAVVFVLL